MSAGQNLKFQGSSFAVQTGFGTAKTISGITQADPGVVTSTAHGLTDGTPGKIAAVLGMTQLNGNMYVIDNSETNSFELADTDTSGYTAYASGGTFTPATFTDFCELAGANQQDGTADQVEVTTICSTAKEFVQGLDTGTLALDYNFVPTSTVQSAMRAAKVAASVIGFKITFPDGTVIVVLGTVQSTSFTGATNGVWKGTASIKLTGDLFVIGA